MSLITDIQAIVKDVNADATFRFSSYFKANVKAHSLKKAELPYIVMDNELTKNVEIMKNANLQKETRIRIYFLNLDNKNNDDLQRQAIIEDMEAIADRVFVKIFQLSYVRVVGTGNPEYSTDPIFNAFSSDFSGVVSEIVSNIQVIANWC